MFEILYDSLSTLFSGRWPTAEGEVTASNVKLLPGEEATLGLEIAYKFFVGEDGPYVGISTWDSASTDEARTIAAKRALPLGTPVLVRYRHDDPSVNRLDRSAWSGL